MNALRPWIRLLLQRKGRLAVGAILMLSTVLAAVALLGLSGWFITATGLTALVMATGVLTYFDVYVPGAGIRAFALTRTVSRYLERLYNHDTILRLLADLRLHLFGRLSRIHPARLTRLRSSQWLNRLTQDVDALDNLYLRLLAPPLVALISSVVVGAVVSLWLPPAALGLFAGLMGLLVFSTWVPARLGFAAGQAMATSSEQLRWHSIDHLHGMAELKAAHRLGNHRHRLWQAHEQLQHSQARQARQTALVNSLATAWLAVLVLMLLVLGIVGYRDGTITGPVLVMLLLATLALSEAFAALPKAFAQFGQTYLAAERLNAVAAIGGEAAPVSSQSSVAESPIVSARNLHTSRQGEPLLANLSFLLNPGETLIVTGASGSGKSTLAGLIAGLHSPDAGEIRIRGLAPPDWPLTQAASPLAWLTQDTHVFSDTVANNLLLARPDASDRDLWSVLETVELADRVEQCHGGLDAWVGEGGVPLSGGEQRRLALARILLTRAPLVLFDEPFRGLDKATAERIMKRLETWQQDRAMVWLAHEHSVLPRSDHRVALSMHPGPDAS
ncbi:MAG: thiol reductant ABC exporter subunit CydC [Saccharospirillum sp.]